MKNLKKSLLVLFSIIILNLCFNQSAYAAFSNEAWRLWYPDYVPISNMTDVPIDKKFIINFSSAVKKESIYENGIELVDSNIQKKISMSYIFINEKKVQAVPEEKLEEGKTYFLLVHKSIKDIYDNPIENGIVSVINVKKNPNSGIIIKPVEKTKEQESFINEIEKSAIESYNKYGIYPSVTIGQAIIESNWGKSDKALQCNNIFGIKGEDKSWTGPVKELPTKEWVNGKFEPAMSKWRVYSSFAESVDDHGKFLYERKHYRDAGVFKATNYLEQIQAIKGAGYATDPDYVKIICSCIERYELWKYDNNGKVITMN